MADDWFRSPATGPDALAAFEARLMRSRPERRGQYLRIKALSVGDAGKLDDALVLLRRVLADYPESFEVPATLEAIGDYERSAGRLAEAERAYRELLRVQPDLNTTSGSVHLSLAEVLLDQRRDVNEVFELLQQALPHVRLNAQVFRWNLALAEAAERVGEDETRRDAARRALVVADEGPQFPRHPGVGLARPDAATLDRLKHLAR